MNRNAKTDTDILIIGGGIVGLTASLAAARCGARVTIVDAQAPELQTLPEFDGRASAVAASSYKMLKKLGVAEFLTGQTGPINDILISDGETGAVPSPLTLHFDAREMSNDGGIEPMGHMVENRHLRLALLSAVKEVPHIEWEAPAKVADASGSTITLEDGRTLTAKLIIAADGRNSRVRRCAGIEVTGWDYDQMGIVTTVAHELPHEGVAHELFLPSGPFAILPLADNENGTHRCSIVWTDSARAAKAAKALQDDLFAAELARRFGDFLGNVTPCAPVWVYPLGLQLAKTYTAPRTLLIGDAAHSIHPIAGQGLNMGLRDVAALADVLQTAVDTGQDIGGDVTLGKYESWRKFDNHLLAGATDIFNRLFSNNIAPIKHARRLGLGAIDKLAPARQFFMKEASGQIGELPSLLR